MFFFAGSKNRKLLGFLHCPDSASSSLGIVYCHPFAEEKNMSHRVMVKAARMFAGEGIPVFRFDFSGCGDSEGDLRFSSLEDWQQDLDIAIELFRKETGVSQCLLWGLRLGAGLALLRQQSGSNIAGLVLWQPVLDFAAHITQFRRRAISTQISKNRDVSVGQNVEDDVQCDVLTHVIGYPISKELWDSFNTMGNQPANVIPTVPTIILSISMMEQSGAVIKKYSERLKEEGSPITLQHVTAEPFWDRYWQWECKQSFDATLQWLQAVV